MIHRRIRKLLAAYHDGELAPDRRELVEAHLRSCPGCASLLDRMRRADVSAAVPEPGKEYWDRFNVRVMERVRGETHPVARESSLPQRRPALRPILRYYLPAAAAVVLVVVIARQTGMKPPLPTEAVPPPPQPYEARTERPAEAKTEPQGKAGNLAAPARKKEPSAEVPPAGGAKEGIASPGWERQAVPKTEVLLDQVLPAEARDLGEAGKDVSRTEGKAEDSTPRTRIPPAAASAPSVPGEDADVLREKRGVAVYAHEAAPAARMKAAAASPPAGEAFPPQPQPSSCELAYVLAAQGRLEDAETAQRACLVRDQSPPAQESGLVFLVEILDRQAKFAQADSVLSEARNRFPRSRSLALYLQQRPLVQQQVSPAERSR